MRFHLEFERERVFGLALVAAHRKLVWHVLWWRIAVRVSESPVVTRLP